MNPQQTLALLLLLADLRSQIADLGAENAALRQALAAKDEPPDMDTPATVD